jgi:Ala-tRNA(Pro) deacylase
MGFQQFKFVKELLELNGIDYEVLEHAPVYTSEEAARVRRVELKTGVKALILKTEKGNFVIGLVAADRKIDLKKLAKIAGVKKLQLASPEEMFKTTGCEVGSVHPFGNLFDLPTYLDTSILENDKVNFNAGLHTVSIQMRAKDMIKAIRPVVEDFSKI